ncbi:MFS transporter [Levilactobacillus bambusae]|nr:MFS transporter [Levilactobacillus bambusae]
MRSIKQPAVPVSVWLAVLATGLLSLIGTTVHTALNIALPKIMGAFSVTTDVAQWVISSYSLAVAIVVCLSPFFMKRFSTRHLFVTAVSLFLIGLFISGWAPNFIILLVGRMVQGAAGGLAIPLMYNTIIKTVPESKWGVMMGVGTLIATLGPAIGPVFGSLMVQLLNWRWIFFLSAIVVVVAFLLGIRTIHPIQKTTDVHLDGWSVILIAVMLASATFWLASVKNSAISPWLTWGCLGLSGLATWGFVHRSKELTHPIINLAIFKVASFRRQLVAFFISQVAAVAVGFILSNYVQIVNRQTPIVAAWVVFPGALFSALVAPVSGRWLDRLGAQKVLPVGTVIYTLGLLAFIISGQFMGAFLISMIYFGYMFGIGVSTSNLMTSGDDDLASGERESGNAVFDTAEQFAGAAGTTIPASVIAGFQAGKRGIAYVSGTKVGAICAFIILFGMALVANIALYLVFRDYEREQKVQSQMTEPKGTDNNG